MGDVAALVGHHPVPIPFGQGPTKLSGRLPVPVKWWVDGGRINQRNLARNKSVLVGIGALDARVGFVGGPVHLLGEEFLIVGVDFFNFQHRQGLLLVGEQDGIAALQAKLGNLRLGQIEDDGNAPDVPALQGHVAGHRVQVGEPHETFQRREEAVCDVDAFPGNLVANGMRGKWAMRSRSPAFSGATRSTRTPPWGERLLSTNCFRSLPNVCLRSFVNYWSNSRQTYSAFGAGTLWHEQGVFAKPRDEGNSSDWGEQACPPPIVPAQTTIR